MKTLLKTALAAAAIALLPQAASATGISVTLNGWAHAGSASTATINNETPVYNGSVSAGAFAATGAYGGYTYDFDAWCIDLLQTASIGSTVSNYALDYGSNVLGMAKANRLQTLATQRLSSVVNAESSAAFQLAIWEIVYEDGNAALSLGSGNFEASAADGAALSLANAWLANLATNLAPTYTLAVLTSATHQDFGGFVPNPGTQVPEPATTALLGLGLLGLSGLRRRRGN